MKDTSTIKDFEVFEASISAKTTWLFLRVTAQSGVTGLGEITYFGREAGVRQQVDILRRAAAGLPVRQREAFLRDRHARERGRIARLVLSGLEQALIDICARELQVAAVELIGGARTDAVACYANVNRGTVDRSPQGYAERARRAVDLGYRTLKLAPFDGVVAKELGGPDGDRLIAAGVARVRAVRDAVGGDVRLNVDCHGRFNEVTAKAIIRDLADVDLYWLEEPIPEGRDRYQAIRRLRSYANDRGIRLAGGESEFGVAGYRGIVESECLDVVLPDIRFCGGVQEVLRIAHYVTSAGCEFSLHNPVGPVLDAVSLQTACAAPAATVIERTFEEVAGQATLVDPGLRHPADAPLVERDLPGWGIDLDEAAVAAIGRPDRSADFHNVAGAGQYA